MRRIFFVVLVVLLLGWFMLPEPRNPNGRETFIVVSDPMIVFSWNETDRNLTLLVLPSDLFAEGTHGYGIYSLSSFWRLGELDKKDGTVLAESVSEVLGIPIDGYIGPRVGIFPFTDTALTSIKKVFSFMHAVSLRNYRTNISIKSFIKLVWLLNFSRPNHVKTYDFSQSPERITQDSTLPDGTHRLVIDPQRIDAELKAVFEDDDVRQEPITVAVYNTTDMPSLGNKAARMLTNLGISVVTVGNDTPQVKECILSGNPDVLKSMSARIIIWVLHCIPRESESIRADLSVRIGSIYMKRFLPN